MLRYIESDQSGHDVPLSQQVHVNSYLIERTLELDRLGTE